MNPSSSAPGHGIGFWLEAGRIAPLRDPAWAAASAALQMRFWAEAGRFAAAAWDRARAAGLDRFGRPLARLAPYTVKHRRSAMGPARAAAPPLTPADAPSRTRSFLRWKSVPGKGVYFWWKHDPRTGASWGVILDYHARGLVPNAPVRDVIGFGPAEIQAVAKHMAQWWAARRGRVPGAFAAHWPAPEEPRPGPAVPARPAAALPPRRSVFVPTGGRAVHRDHLTRPLSAAEQGEVVTWSDWGQYIAPPRPPRAPRPIPLPTPRPTPTTTTTTATPRPRPRPRPASAPAQPAAYRTRRAERERAIRAYCARHAPAHGLTPEAYRQRATAALQQTVDALEPCTRVWPETLIEVLTEGRWKSQFETGRSSGLYDPALRTQVEETVLGLPVATPPAQRPAYGYLGLPAAPPDDAIEDLLRTLYGPILVRLKPAVRPRTTFTVGDSLDGRDRLQAAPIAQADLRAFPEHDLGFDLLAQPAGPELAAELTQWYAYIEAQYRGLTPDLVLEILIETNAPPDPALVAALDASGIPWRIRPIPTTTTTTAP